MASKFVCKVCGYESSKWYGRCPSCGTWNSMVEVRESEKKGRAWLSEGERSEPLPLSKVETGTSERIEIGIGEVDRVLGGGIRRGAFVLIGGDPGVGKSTLLLQIAGKIAEKGYRILYITGEESLPQLKDRAERLGVPLFQIYGLQESELRRIIEISENLKPDILFIDSIQTIYHPDIASVPGSITQVRECGAELLRFAKKTGTAILTVGHVTKDGTLAGPRTLEHMVDVVLYLEGENLLGLRILRSTKNRFGPTHEIGVFEMTTQGLVEVQNPSGLFISRTRRKKIGVVTIPLLEGRRPLLVEVQALVVPSPFAVPQRNVTGYDLKRLSMLIAVLEKRTGISLRKADVFINVTGGMRITDSSADLGVAIAIYSSYKKIALKRDLAVIGELDLGGEVRSVPGINLRVEEAKRLGYKSLILPLLERKIDIKGIELIEVEDIKEALRACVG